jgi:hypothetical protein
MIVYPDTMTILAVCQLLLDVILLIAIFAMFRRVRTLDHQKLDTVLDALRKAERICLGLEENLRQKDRLVRQLNSTIHSRAPSMDLPPHPHKSDTSPGTNEMREKILALSREGKGVSEIAQATETAQSEVELVLSLAKTQGR